MLRNHKWSYNSFNLPVLSQINMLELAKQHLEDKRGYQVIAGVFCPTPDTILRKKFKSQPTRGTPRNPLTNCLYNFMNSLQFYSLVVSESDGFVGAEHRTRMIELSIKGKEWIKVDRWAANNSAPAAKVHQHVFETYNPGKEKRALVHRPVIL